MDLLGTYLIDEDYSIKEGKLIVYCSGDLENGISTYTKEIQS